MKRFTLFLVAIVLSVPLAGCGGASTATGPPPDDSNLPSEVKEYESRRAAERSQHKTPGKVVGGAARKH